MNGDSILRVYETFAGIQGESTRAGMPCFFIRLSGCPLRCAWCDTLKARSFEAGEDRRVSSLVRETVESGIPLAEVTGGEPLAQKGTPELCRQLLDAGLQVLMETNGAEDCSVLPEGVIRIVDMKTPSSGESGKMLRKNFLTLRSCDEVKFVICDRRDYDFARQAITEYGLAAQTPHILFSPAFGTMDMPKLCEWILHDRLPVRINLQFHKIIWGADAEGV